MRRRLLLPLAFIVLMAAGGLTAAVLTDSSPELGLDLQGGVSVVLEPTSQADEGQLDVALEIIRNRVDALGVAEPEIVRQGGAIVVQLPGVENRERIRELVGRTAELRFRPVLDAQPVPGSEAAEETDSTSTTAPADPAATTAPADPAATTAPAPADSTSTSEAALGAMEGESATGLMEGEVAGGLQEETTTTAPPDTTATTAPADPTATTAPAAEAPPIEVTPPDDDAEEAQVNLEDKEGQLVYQLGPTLATGRVVQSASAELDQAGRWQIALTMRGGAEGIDKFNAAAAACNPPGELCPTGQLAIVLDSVVQSAPAIQQASFERDGIVISSDQDPFSESEAKDLALVLRYGSLPVELQEERFQTVSASLGEDSLRAGVVAGVAGLILVAIYMLLYYRALGLVVMLGLCVWGSLLYATISWLGAAQGLALTLAGVTGIIVSVGVTVDSYVVFFERLKDEVKAGRTLRASTERAFKRAYRTILAADVSAFIGAAILWWLTVGSVRGFAFFLGLSTVLDVVVAWFFTRPVVTLLSRSRLFTEAPVVGVARGLAAPPSASAAAAGTGAGGGGR
jgi:preprotein translocase subunit SecD